MTDRVEALRALLGKVEAGERVSFGDTDDICAALIPGATLADAGMFRAACEGTSLDAALALHNAVLPGWTWSTADDAHDERWFVVGDGVDYETEETYNDTPARAWLCAILKALIAEQEGEGA